MSDCSNAQLACAIIDAWNSRDLRRFLALLSEDCVVENCHEAPAVGHDAARTLLQRYVTDLPSVWFDVIKVVATEHTAVVSWWALGTLCDEGGGGTARRPVKVSGCTVVGVKHGKVVRLWHYWDTDESVHKIETERVQPLIA